MKSQARKMWVAVLLAVVLLVTLAQSAFAEISFCDIDLGPMATIAEANNAPQASAAEGLVVTVPAVAVSTAKGGANPNK